MIFEVCGVAFDNGGGIAEDHDEGEAGLDHDLIGTRVRIWSRTCE